MTQTTYPAAQQPQEPKKKRGVLKWILIIVGAIIALLIIAAVFGGGEDTAAQPTAGGSQAPSDKPTSDASKATSDASKAVPTYKVGEKVTDDGYQFAVTSVSCGVRRVGDQSMGEDAAGQFCLVNLRVKNVSKDPMNFSSENQALVDSKGRTYSPDDEAWPYVEENVDVTREIDPGNALKTTVPFDVPKKAKPDYLLLKAGVFGFSEGVRVKL
jgi:hypothetical protein